MAAGEEGGESGKVSLPHSKGHNKGEALMIRAERKMIHIIADPKSRNATKNPRCEFRDPAIG